MSEIRRKRTLNREGENLSLKLRSTTKKLSKHIYSGPVGINGRKWIYEAADCSNSLGELRGKYGAQVSEGEVPASLCSPPHLTTLHISTQHSLNHPLLPFFIPGPHPFTTECIKIWTKKLSWSFKWCWSRQNLQDKANICGWLYLILLGDHKDGDREGSRTKIKDIELSVNERAST